MTHAIQSILHVLGLLLCSGLFLLSFHCSAWQNIGPKRCTDNTQCDTDKGFFCKDGRFCVRSVEDASTRDNAQGDDGNPECRTSTKASCSCYPDGRVRLFPNDKIATKAVVRVLSHPSNRDILFSASGDGKIRIWNTSNIENIKFQHTIDVTEAVSDFDIDPSGKKLVVASESGQLKMYDVSINLISGKGKTFTPKSTASAGGASPHLRFIRGESSASSPSRFVVGDNKGNVSIWGTRALVPPRLRLRRLASVSSGQNQVQALIADVNTTERFFTAHSNGNIHVWRVTHGISDATLAQKSKVTYPSSDSQNLAVSSLARDNSGTDLLAAGGMDGQVQMWAINVSKDELVKQEISLKTKEQNLGSIDALAFEKVTGEKGLRLYAGTSQGTLFVWESSSSQQPVTSYETAYTYTNKKLDIRGLLINPTKDVLFGGLGSGGIQIWTCIPSKL